MRKKIFVSLLLIILVPNLCFAGLSDFIQNEVSEEQKDRIIRVCHDAFRGTKGEKYYGVSVYCILAQLYSLQKIEGFYLTEGSEGLKKLHDLHIKYEIKGYGTYDYIEILKEFEEWKGKKYDN